VSGILGQLFDRGTIAGLERAVQFTVRRHESLLSNVANADTPGYRRTDLDQGEFRRLLARSYAADATGRRDAFEGVRGDRAELVSGSRGPFRFSSLGRGPLRHDGNDVSVEREMALLSENAGKYSAYSALLRKGLRQMRAAITGRPEEA